MSVGITAPSALPDLPATVAFTPDHVELVVITDAGGPAEDWVIGVGLSSMRERAAEVGGTLTTRATAAGGRVEAHLRC